MAQPPVSFPLPRLNQFPSDPVSRQSPEPFSKLLACGQSAWEMEVYADTDYLSGFVPRALFFACSGVLVVGGFTHWKISSLRLGYRVLAFLLVLFATLVTAFFVYDQALFLPGIMLVVAALGKRFAAKSQVIVLSVLALTGFSAFEAINELVKYHYGVKDAFVPILALVLNGAATYCAFRLARTKPQRMPATGSTA